MDVLDAETQGMIGYLVERELGNRLPYDKPIASLFTVIEVAPNECDFARATGKAAAIGALGDIEAMLADTAGTRISQDVEDVELIPSAPKQ